MRELVFEWYAFLSTFNALVGQPLRAFADSFNVPMLSAIVFGLIGATSPCQLTTNASALAFVVQRASDRRAVATSALAYLVGKLTVYTILGLAVILAGQQLAQNTIPLIVAARKLIGPLMMLLGLALFGLLPLRFSVGSRAAAWLESRSGSGTLGAFLLGIAFSLAFCPTLFLLFFGLTIPLALTSPVGAAYPGLFALGTTLPLLGLAALMALGIGGRTSYLAGARRLDRWLRPAAGLVLVLMGLNDTITYWFL